jgi:type VI secretion system VasI family protein
MMKRSLISVAGLCLLAASPAVPAAAQSKWIVEQGRSTRDNSRAVSLKLLADKGPVGFSALCIEGRTGVTIIALEPPPLPPDTTVLALSYRVDMSAPRRRSFTVSDRGKSFDLNGEPAIEMLKELFGGERLTLRYELSSGSIEAAELTISGLDGAIRPFREACRW